LDSDGVIFSQAGFVPDSNSDGEAGWRFKKEFLKYTTAAFVIPPPFTG